MKPTQAATHPSSFTLCKAMLSPPVISRLQRDELRDAARQRWGIISNFRLTNNVVWVRPNVAIVAEYMYITIRHIFAFLNDAK